MMNDISVVDKKIESLEKKFLNMPQIPCSVTHKFGPGVYMREVFLPKGAFVIGHHQNFEHVNIFLKGKLAFFKEGKSVEMVAPMTFVGQPGRKIAYVLEDTTFINVYATNETDVDKLEAHFLTKSDSFQIDQKHRQELELLTSSVDQDDYLKALAEFGITHEEAKRISENDSDMTAFPLGDYKFKISKSRIEGLGVFATGSIDTDEVIAYARYEGKRTPVGRYTNHSVIPNAKMVQKGPSDILLVSLKPIQGCLGGQDGEEITVDYREALKLNISIGGKTCQP